MSTIECQFCGARLILPEGDLPPEARCKRCGRRVEIKQARRPASTSSQSRRPSQARPAQTTSATPPPRFEPLPKEAPRVDAYPTQTPPPVPTRTVRSSNPWKLAGLTAAAVLGLAVTVVAVQQAMHRKVPGTEARVTPPPANRTDTKPPEGESFPRSNPSTVVQQQPRDGARGRDTRLADSPAGESRPDAHSAASATQAGSAKPQTASRTDSLRGTTGLAKSIEATALFNKTIYANSELALSQVEEDRLSRKEEDQEAWFLSNFGFQSTEDAGEELRGLAIVTQASFRASEDWLFEHRPVFSVKLTNVPEGTKAQVSFLRLNDTGKRLLAGSQATKQEMVLLDRTKPQPNVWFHERDEKNKEDWWEIGLQPMWEVDQLAAITAPEFINFEISITYADGSEDSHLLESVKVMPPHIVEHQYPLALGIVGLVNGQHPWIERILNDVNQSSLAKRLGINVSGGAGPANSLLAAFMIWRELHERGLRYSSLPGSTDSSAQSIRSIDDTLVNRNANCVDGTVLFCSFFERMGMENMIVLPSGHAFVLFSIVGTSSWWGLETTDLADNDPCTDGFRSGLFDAFPDLKDLYSRLPTAEQHRFDCFLKAMEDGEKRLTVEFAKIKQGAKSEFGDVPPVAQLVEKFNSEADQNTKDKLVSVLNSVFVKITPVSKARAAGVQAIPVSKNIDQRVKLPPQPASTR